MRALAIPKIIIHWWMHTLTINDSLFFLFHLIFILDDHLPGSLCKGHKMIINGNPVMGTPNTISSSKPWRSSNVIIHAHHYLTTLVMREIFDSCDEELQSCLRFFRKYVLPRKHVYTSQSCSIWKKYILALSITIS